MRRLSRVLANPLLALAAIAAVATPCHAQRASPAGPIVRQIGRQIAIATDSFGPAITIRPLSDGRVVVNDMLQHRLVLLDAMLAHSVLIADSTTAHGTRRAYVGNGNIVAYSGDSTVFVDAPSLSMIMIDPAGHLGRIFAPPHPSAVISLLVWHVVGGPGAFDVVGRATYRVVGGTVTPRGYQFSVGGIISATATRDTNVVVRANPATQSLDTLGFLTAQRSEPGLKTTDSLGRTVMLPMINPIRLVDDDAIFSDGTVAIIRGQDYHIDWIDADGTRRATPKIPHEWHRLTDSEKVVIVDSTKAWAAAHPDIRRSGSQDGIIKTTPVVSGVVDPSVLADYRAPFFLGARADADGRVWIPQPPLPGATADGGPIYDVVDRAGQLVDRVQIPGGTSLGGFAPGVAFLTARLGQGTSLAVYRIR